MIRFVRRINQQLRTDDAIAKATGGVVSRLNDSDVQPLMELIDRDPIANCYPVSIIEQRATIGPRTGPETGMFLGIWDPEHTGRLEAACWVGSNIVPITANSETGYYLGAAINALGRRFGSIFGPREAVEAIWEQMDASGRYFARSIRRDQPLMVMSEPSSVEPDPRVRYAHDVELPIVLPAAVKMFTEELGYSPLITGEAGYKARVRSLIRNQHCMIATGDPYNQGHQEVIFKADFGVVTDKTIQIQGVWITPALRGHGLAAPAMAAVVNHALQVAPTVSLYVNSYNEPALRTYERVGFERVSTFATVLF